MILEGIRLGPFPGCFFFITIALDKNNENNYIFFKRTYHLLAKSNQNPLVKFFNVLWFNLRHVQILFTRANFRINFRFVEFILKNKNVNCVLEFLYRNGSKNQRELCERTDLSLATVISKNWKNLQWRKLGIKKRKRSPSEIRIPKKGNYANCFEKSSFFSRRR